tara:strand:- start:462 stop:590 length:129 start_codon:yes stop_codon:yes gene_type:complete
MEHLINCHGEWNLLFALASSIPFIGVWLKTKLGSNYEKTPNN